MGIVPSHGLVETEIKGGPMRPLQVLSGIWPTFYNTLRLGSYVLLAASAFVVNFVLPVYLSIAFSRRQVNEPAAEPSASQRHCYVVALVVFERVSPFANR